MKFRIRKTLRARPYFRHYSARADRHGGVRGGFTSHGFRIPLGPLGKLTWNITHHRWTWDSPGPGSFTWGGRRR